MQIPFALIPLAFRGDRGRGPEPPASSRRLQVDAGEDHGQLRRVQLDAVAIAGVGHLEAADLEPLVPDGQAVMIEVECLDAIPPAVDEEEEMAVEEVLAEALLDEAREAVERGIFLIPLAVRSVRTSRP
jgi:hypothetical protein